MRRPGPGVASGPQGMAVVVGLHWGMTDRRPPGRTAADARGSVVAGFCSGRTGLRARIGGAARRGQRRAVAQGCSAELPRLAGSHRLSSAHDSFRELHHSRGRDREGVCPSAHGQGAGRSPGADHLRLARRRGEDLQRVLARPSRMWGGGPLLQPAASVKPIRLALAGPSEDACRGRTGRLRDGTLRGPILGGRPRPRHRALARYRHCAPGPRGRRPGAGVLQDVGAHRRAASQHRAVRRETRLRPRGTCPCVSSRACRARRSCTGWTS